MARANVPKFGNWENQDDVPFTVCFDKARKNRGGKMINPNDPKENPDMFRDIDPPPVKARATKAEEPIRRQAVRPTPDHHRLSPDDINDFRQSDQNMGRGSSRGQRPGGRSTRPSMGSEQSFERSPLHQAKVVTAGRGTGTSPAWEGRNYDSSHATPARSQLKPTRGDESPDKGAAVPRFGEWNEKDPQSAENFTYIFNKVREERNVGAGNAFGSTPKHQSYPTRAQRSNERKACCFPW